MKERLQKLIDALNSKREGLLEKALQKLQEYSTTEPGPQPQGMEAITFIGLVNDVDHHITFLTREIKRLDSIQAMQAQSDKGGSHV